ncbi:NAD(P)-dependent oxidoreductase, partial [Pseudomonas aeruginosa]|nr:NAD(P)-dependent oxidoreductase [Pseudomonas aeruginosa]
MLITAHPVLLWSPVKYVMRHLDLPPVGGHLPYAVGYGLAALNEGVCRILPGRPEPVLFRQGIADMAKNFSQELRRARGYLGAEPRVSMWYALDE